MEHCYLFHKSILKTFNIQVGKSKKKNIGKLLFYLFDVKEIEKWKSSTSFQFYKGKS